MKALGFEITYSEVERFFRSGIFQVACFAMAVFCGVLAFGPETLVRRLQLEGVKARLGSWLGISFVFGSVVWAVVFFRGQWLKFRVSRLYKGRDADSRIARLSPAARGYLCEMFLRPEHGGQYNFYDPTFMELRDVKAVRYPSSGYVVEFPCYLQPWVVAWLKRHPEMIENYQRGDDTEEQLNAYP